LALQQSWKGPNDAFVSKIAPLGLVSVSPQSLSLSQQALDTTGKPKTIIVTNNGSGLLTINTIYVSGANPDDFVQTNTCGSSLAPNTSCTISVIFTPTDIKHRKTVLGISDSDPTSPQAVTLNGTGTFVNVSAKSLAFGKVAVGSGSSSQTLTLTNEVVAS